MAVRCMLTVLLLTCCVVLLIIIFTNFNEESKSNYVYHPSGVSIDEFIRTENDKLIQSNNPMKILNLANFRYLIDTKCNYQAEVENSSNSPKFKIVWIITSYAGDVSKRSALRQAYTSEELRELGVRRIFLLGTLDQQAEEKTGITQSAIKNEAERFQDILQGNFVEAYKNLTYKHLMGLQWAVDRCSRTHSYIMKMDDDIVINLYEAISLIQQKQKSSRRENFLMGYVLDHMSPIRNTANKWFVTYEEFPQKNYPPFLSGWFYVTNMLTALKIIYQSKHHSKYFWIDDLFITGILREEAGIHDYINIKELFTSDYRFFECCLKDQKSENKYKCDFIVGPDGGESNLLQIFKSFSEDCYVKGDCSPRPKDQLIEKTCILDFRNSVLESNIIGSGEAQVEEMFSNAII